MTRSEGGGASSSVDSLPDRIVCALLLGSTGSGCSLFLPKGHPNERCRTNRSVARTTTSVPWSTGLPGLPVGRTAFAISQDDDYYHRHNLPYSRTADIAVGAALTVLFATSMGVGIDRVSRCKEADASFSQGPHARHPVSGPVEWTPEGVHRGKSAARAEEDAEDEAAAPGAGAGACGGGCESRW